MNRLFDCFNSRNCLSTDIFKNKLSKSNARAVFKFFDETIKYITALKVEVIYYKNDKSNDDSVDDCVDDCVDNMKSDKEKKQKKNKKRIVRIEFKPILHTKKKTAFRGFIINMVSLKGMYKLYVQEEKVIDSIPTYSLLQDVLEMLFSRIRSCGGFNNNPNLQQLKGGFRKIQCNLRLDLSPNTNCRMFDSYLPDNLFFSNIYSVSSVRSKVEFNSDTYESQKLIILESINKQEENATAADDAPKDKQQQNVTDTPDASSIVSPILADTLGTSEFMVIYYAILIESELTKQMDTDSSVFHCNKEDNSCRTIFAENEKVCATNLQFTSYMPCVSTIKICKRVVV